MEILSDVYQLVEPLVFEPGSDWAYGQGVDWAGQLVYPPSAPKYHLYTSQLIAFKDRETHRLNTRTVLSRKHLQSFRTEKYHVPPPQPSSCRSKSLENDVSKEGRDSGEY